MKLNSAMLRVHVFVLLLMCTATMFAQSESTPGSWNIAASPNGAKCKMPYPLCLTPEEGNVFYATAALSSTDVWAVGAEPHQSSVLTATLAEHWDGTDWSIVPTPAISVKQVQHNSVSAVRSNDVWAAGFAWTTYRARPGSVGGHWSNIGMEANGQELRVQIRD